MLNLSFDVVRNMYPELKEQLQELRKHLVESTNEMAPLKVWQMQGSPFFSDRFAGFHYVPLFIVGISRYNLSFFEICSDVVVLYIFAAVANQNRNLTEPPSWQCNMKREVFWVVHWTSLVWGNEFYNHVHAPPGLIISPDKSSLMAELPDVHTHQKWVLWNLWHVWRVILRIPSRKPLKLWFYWRQTFDF